MRNIEANRGLFLAGVVAHLVTFVLLAAVHRALALLAAWFRLVYAAVALGALMHLVTAVRLIDGGAYGEAFGAHQLHAQVEVLIRSFRYEWSLSIALFGIHVARAATWRRARATSRESWASFS